MFNSNKGKDNSRSLAYVLAIGTDTTEKLKQSVIIKLIPTRQDIVKPAGNSGRIYLPKDWVGKFVKVTLVEGVKK